MMKMTEKCCEYGIFALSSTPPPPPRADGVGPEKRKTSFTKMEKKEKEEEGRTIEEGRREKTSWTFDRRSIAAGGGRKGRTHGRTNGRTDAEGTWPARRDDDVRLIVRSPVELRFHRIGNENIEPCCLPLPVRTITQQHYNESSFAFCVESEDELCFRAASSNSSNDKSRVRERGETNERTNERTPMLRT